MKHIRQKSAATVDKTLQKIIVDSSNEVYLDSKTGLRIPLGLEAERPESGELGQIRFINTTPAWTPGDPITSGYYEAYTTNGWQEMRMYEPREIHVQNFTADGIATQFGPLDNNDDQNPTSFVGRPQSIMVYIENVYQLPTTNYTIIQQGQDYYVSFGTNPPPDQKPITILHNFDK